MVDKCLEKGNEIVGSVGRIGVFLVGFGERIETAATVTTNFQVRKFLLEIVGGGFVEREELLHGAFPAGVVCDFRGIVRLVPNLPVLNIVMITICPTVIIVLDDALTDLCPF